VASYPPVVTSWPDEHRDAGHGGTVEAANADGGGLVLRLAFPTVDTGVLELGVRVA
jgi:hypothetical protein